MKKREKIGVFLALFIVFMMGMACVPAMAEEVYLPEGVYRIRALANGLDAPYLYYSPDLSSGRQCQFQKYKDYGEYDPETFFNNPGIDKSQLWFIKKCQGYYLIYNYEGYVEGSKDNKLLRVEFREKTYINPADIYCEPTSSKNIDFQAKFLNQDNDTNDKTAYIRQYNDDRYLNAMCLYYLFKPDIWYLEGREADHNYTKYINRWKLEPFEPLEARYYVEGKKWYTQSVILEGEWCLINSILFDHDFKNETLIGWRLGGDDSGTIYKPGQDMSARKEDVELYAVLGTTVSTKTEAPTLTAKKNGRVTIDWTAFRRKMKKKAFWKKAKYIEIQYSTDKKFRTIDGIKKIKKGTVDKAKAKTTIKNLKSNKTYYVRARLWDGNKKVSKWSKTVKFKSK